MKHCRKKGSIVGRRVLSRTRDEQQNQAPFIFWIGSIAHAVAAGVMSVMEEGWVRKDMEESLRHMPTTTEDVSSVKGRWETETDLSLYNTEAMVVDGNGGEN
ncbi:hypothetical protein L2E82_18504 [Cichorium intybus]|uniref:Uncharacterized protein n=1 Tax=Cichorium intybus TaxID=13427 RepID=A0ACB9FBR1_CICIN|nr:hypothetical protein L2E82_18504 [Cichorium intybus]